MSKPYTGSRTITAKPAGPDYREGLWRGYIDGQSFYGLWGNTEAEALAAAGRAAARMDADEAIWPAAAAVAGTFTEEQASRFFPVFGTGPEDFTVGQTVAVYSRGRIRVGLVEKIGRKNVTVVYVTESTGALWRKAMPFDKVSFAREPQGLTEAGQAIVAVCDRRPSAETLAKAKEALCDHVDTERHRRTAHGYLGDAPRGTVQTLCGDCGFVLAEIR